MNDLKWGLEKGSNEPQCTDGSIDASSSCNAERAFTRPHSAARGTQGRRPVFAACQAQSSRIARRLAWLPWLYGRGLIHFVNIL